MVLSNEHNLPILHINPTIYIHSIDIPQRCQLRSPSTQPTYNHHENSQQLSQLDILGFILMNSCCIPRQLIPLHLDKSVPAIGCLQASHHTSTCFLPCILPA